MDDDDLLGPSVPAHADSMGLDLEDNEDLLGSGGAVPLLDDDDDFLSSDPTPSKSESANGQKGATNQAMIDNANEAMRLEELNKKMEQKKEQFKVLLASLRVQVEALKPTASNHDPKSLQTQIRALRAEIESYPAVIERMRKVQDMARKKIDSLDSELQNLREERKHDLEKNRSERENADMMKYTQAMQLQKNAFKREIEAMTVVAEKYEEYVEKITPFASNPTEYCTQADILINNLTDLFYKERDEKNAFKKESAEIEQSIQTLRESYEKVSEELKVKRREVLKKTMEIREKGAGASGASDRKDFADMIGNIDDDDIPNAPANDSVEKDDDDLLDTDGPPVAAVPTSDGLESDEDLF